VLELCNVVLFSVLVGVLIPLLDSFESEVVLLALVGFIVVLWVGRGLVGLRTNDLDERDMAIRYKAGMLALHGFGMVVMAGAVVLFFINRVDLLVPVIQVAVIAFASWMVMYVVSAVTVLVLYRKAV
jgi:hypothetical protein